MAKECNSTSCTKEDCAGCSQAKKPQSFQVAANEFSQVKKCDRSHQWKRWRGKIFCDGVAGQYDGCERVSSGYYGCGYYRAFYCQMMYGIKGNCEGKR